MIHCLLISTAPSCRFMIREVPDFGLGKCCLSFVATRITNKKLSTTPLPIMKIKKTEATLMGYTSPFLLYLFLSLPFLRYPVACQAMVSDVGLILRSHALVTHPQVIHYHCYLNSYTRAFTIPFKVPSLLAVPSWRLVSLDSLIESIQLYFTGASTQI